MVRGWRKTSTRTVNDRLEALEMKNVKYNLTKKKERKKKKAGAAWGLW